MCQWQRSVTSHMVAYYFYFLFFSFNFYTWYKEKQWKEGGYATIAATTASHNIKNQTEKRIKNKPHCPYKKLVWGNLSNQRATTTHSLFTLFAVLCSCPSLWCAVCLQEIVANLVMHLGSGNVDESDASLDVLAGLVEQHLAAMAPFAIFFKVCQTGFTCVFGLFPTLDWLNFKRALILFVNNNTRDFTVYTCLC